MLYGGDNQNVIGWLDKRQARHPVAVYLLQVLAALEAAHSFRFCGAYVRTYHNVTADDLTRKEPAQVMKEQGLSPLENAAEALRVYLERGWVKRALVWAGQADADRCQALRLADRRSGDTHPFLLHLSGELQRYKLEFLSRGAKCYSESESTELEVNGLDVLTLTLKAGEFDDALNRLSRGAVRARPRLVWVDSLTENLAIKVQQKLREDGYETRLFQVSGRTLKDQVWWRRWVVAGSRTGRPSVPCRTADEEPLTEALKHYDQGWFEAGNEEGGVPGRIHLDPQMPYLGNTKPKPCGSVTDDKGEGRRLLWSPSRPLPALHRGSWDPSHPENLLLHVSGKSGPVARPLLAEEARDLLCGKHDGADLSGSDTAARALSAAPKKLAELAVQWAEGELTEKSTPEGKETLPRDTDNRLGLCKLAWEDETERVLYRWLQENPPGEEGPCGRVGGGKGKRGKSRDEDPHPPSYYASKAISRLLRHDGGREDLPMTHEGWVKWEDLMGHHKLKRFSRMVLYDAVMINDKERFTARPDDNEQWWVAARLYLDV